MCSRHNSQIDAQSCQWASTIIAWKRLFWLLKLRSYLDNKLIAFQQFFSNGKPLKLRLYWLRKLSVDFRHFRVFIFYHRAYSKTRKPQKISISSSFEVLRLFIWLWALFYVFCTFRTQFTKCCSKLSMSIYYYCLKMAFLVIKAKMVLRYQIGSHSAVF